jgi:iron complex transport system substrate-binding protein
VTDGLGRTVTLAGTPQRIVSLAPSVTEMLFAVGAGPQVVGVTKFCNFPAEAEALPEIGGFSARTISIEAIVNLTPDLVIAGTASQRPVVEALEAQQIPVLVLAPSTFEEVYANITQLGGLTGHSSQAAQVVERMQTQVKTVTDTIAAIPAAERPSVFWEITDEPLMTAGPQTFIGQMIELAGATNIFADASEDYPQVSAEVIVERNPTVIVGPDSHGDKLKAEVIATREGWDSVAAVRDGRIFVLNGDIVSRPGPRLADALEALAKALYPDKFQ